MAAQDDVVDLTGLTSPEDQPGERVGGKRRRSEAVDLAGEDSEEEAAKQRIMRFARRVNAERGLGGVAPDSGQQQQQQQQQQAAMQQEHQRAVQEGAEAAGAVPPANQLLAALHAERIARQAQRQQQQSSRAPGGDQPQGGSSQQGAQPPRQQPQWQAGEHTHRQQQPAPQAQAGGHLSLLTYNVWFREDLHVQARMAAIGRIVEARQPDFVCLQEATPLIYQILCSGAWWHAYHATPCPPGTPYFTVLLWHRTRVQGAPTQAAQLPFANSIMGRDLKSISGTVGGLPVRVATAHLESPTGGSALYSEQRVAQCKQSLAVLSRAPEEDVLFAGDMNWNPSDGPPPLPGGWCDAWQELFPGSPGLTYDPKSNPMLKHGNRIRRRLDRAFCRLRRWRLQSAELVGREPLPGLSFEGRPVLPSDHFGLLLTLRPT